MNFVTIQNSHINLDLIVNFYHQDGVTKLFDNSDQPFCFEDPDEKIYRFICDKTGVDPTERENFNDGN